MTDADPWIVASLPSAEAAEIVASITGGVAARAAIVYKARHRVLCDRTRASVFLGDVRPLFRDDADHRHAGSYST